MRLPRDVSGRDLARALAGLGYATVRQSGSHIRLSRSAEPAHQITIPDHSTLRVGTLAAIVADVAARQGLSKDEVLRRLFRD